MDTARTKRLVLVELCIFLTLAGTTALFFQPLMAVINRNITVVMRGLVGRGEALLDRPIRYGSLSPSLVGMVEIRDLTVGGIQGEGGGYDEPLVKVDRFYLEYSLWDLIRGRGTGAVRVLELEGPSLFVDADRDGDLRSFFRGKGKAILPPECRVVLSGGALVLSGGGRSLALEGIFLEGGIGDGRITAQGGLRKPPDPAGNNLSLEGRISVDLSDRFDDGTVRLGIDSAEGPGFEVRDLAFSLSFAEDRILFERDKDNLPLDLRAVYVPGTGDFSASFSAEGFYPQSMIRFSGPLEGLRPLLGLRLSGDAAFALRNTATPSGQRGRQADYRFDLSAEHGGRDVPVRRFDFQGEGDGERLRFSRFRLDAARGQVRYEGDLYFRPFLPWGTAVFSGFSLTGGGGLSGALHFSPIDDRGRERGIRLAASSLSAEDTVLSSLRGEWIRETESRRYTLGFDHSGGGAFAAAGTYTARSGGGPLLEGRGELRAVAASDLLNLARPFVSLGDGGKAARKTALTTEAFFSTDFHSVSFRTGRFEAAYGNSAFLSAAVAGTEKFLAVENGEIRWGRSRAEFGLEADYPRPGDLSFDLRFAPPGFDYWLNGTYRNKVLELRGPGDLSAALERTEAGWSGLAEVYALPVPWRGGRAYVSLAASLVYRNAESWNLALRRLEIREGGASRPALLAGGAANQNGLNLERISWAGRNAPPLEGSAAAVWDPRFSVADASFVLEAGNETLSGDLFFEKGRMNFHARAAEFRLDRLAESGMNLRLSGSLDGNFDGNLDGESRYTVNLELENLSGRKGETSFSASGLALLEPEHLTLSRIRLSAGDIEAEVPSLSVDRAAGRLEGEARAGGVVNEQYLGTDFSLGLNFRPGVNWLDIDPSYLSGVLNVRRAYINDISGEPFALVFTRLPAAEDGPALTRLSGGPGDMLRLEFRERPSRRPQSPAPRNPLEAVESRNAGGFRDSFGGVLTATLGGSSPVQGNIAGTLDGNFIDLWATDVFIDIAELWKIIPVNKVFNFTGGFISGESRIYGSLFDPEFSGAARGSAVSMTLPQYIPAEIGPASGAITLEGNEISFGPVAAACGGGGGQVSGWVRYNRWIPSVGLEITADRPIPVDMDMAGVRARGEATGNLNLLMENKELLTITGNLDAADTVITIHGNEFDRDADAMDVVSDIRISAGRRVEFIWPDDNMPFLRAYGDMGTSVRITGDTRIPHFAMDGDVVLRGGEVFQLQRSFYIREGLLRFNAADPRIDPRISVRAELRDRNNDGPVTLSMIVDNALLSSLFPRPGEQPYIPRFESTPSLSQLEIYSLLGQAPQVGAVEENQTPWSVIGPGGELLLQSLVLRKVERKIRNVLGLDMFSIRTQFLQNAIYEAVRDRSRDPETERSGSIGLYLNNTAVFVGKYISPDLFLQGMFSFRYDQYQTNYGGIRIEPDIGLDFHTPLFDIRWNVSPEYAEYFRTGKISDPVAGYVGGQSISLLWRWSL